MLFFSLKKSWQVNSLQVPQQGPYGERYMLTGHFYISLDISLYLKGPKIERPLWKQTPIREPYLTYLTVSKPK